MNHFPGKNAENVGMFLHEAEKETGVKLHDFHRRPRAVRRHFHERIQDLCPLRTYTLQFFRLAQYFLVCNLVESIMPNAIAG